MTRASSPPLRPRIRRVLVVLLCLGILATGWRLLPNARRCAGPKRGSGLFTDVRLFLDIAKTVHDTGRLYTPEEPGYFAPSSGVYKYPPTYIALLLPIREMKWRRAVPLLFWINCVIWVTCLALLLLTVRPSLLRGLLLVLVFFNWAPFWESLEGMQLEPAMAMFLAGTVLLCHRRRFFAGGVALGAAASLKVYPIGLAWYLLARPRWRRPALLGTALGAVVPVLAASLFIPIRNLWTYILIFPRLGGVSLFADNLGIPGLGARLAVALIQGTKQLRFDTTRGCDAAYLAAAENHASLWTARVLGYLGSAALIAIAALRVRKSLRAPTDNPVERNIRELLGLALSVCVLLLILPTSWPDYQTLLIVPLLLALAWAPDPRRDPWPWLLLAPSVVAGSLQFSLRTLMAHPDMMPWLRAWIPVAIGGAILLRMRGAQGEAAETAGGLDRR